MAMEIVRDQRPPPPLEGRVWGCGDLQTNPDTNWYEHFPRIFSKIEEEIKWHSTIKKKRLPAWKINLNGFSDGHLRYKFLPS